MNSFRSSGRSTCAAQRGVALAIASLAALAGTSTAQVDLTVPEVIPIQVIPNVPIIAGKSMLVRTAIGVSGTLLPGTTVDGIMRVYVNGVEASFSPVYSENGPIAPPTSFNYQNLDHTLNFALIPPETNDLVMVVEVNPDGPNRVAETNYANNTTTTQSYQTRCADVLDMCYVPIDYRPTGGATPNLPPLNLIEPGGGDNFLQGIYPGPDWDYRLVDGGSKLWTSSVAGSGSALISALAADRLLMTPRPDMIYGWVPGGLSYNGVSTLNGTAAMGNTQTFKYQRTFAHEVGHLFGRNHINNRINTTGIDVEHHLAITENLPRVKDPLLYDVMVAGLNTNQAWCYATNYNVYVNHARYQCNNNDPITDVGEGANLLISGTWNRADNTVDVMDLVAFLGGSASEFVPVEQADLVVRAFGQNGLMGEFGIDVATAVDCGDEAPEHAEGVEGDSEMRVAPIESFAVALPKTIDPEAIVRLTISERAAQSPMVDLDRSSNRPQIDVLSPVGSITDNVVVEIAVSDSDSTQTKHYLRYSPDGTRMVPLATNTTSTRFDVDMSKVPAFVPGKGFFEILVSDGLNTSRVLTTGLAAESAGNNPPSTYIMSPDPNKTFQQGATIFLHSSGWDMEDFGLYGASVVWSSDIDGVVATGRMTSTASLSPGTHQLSVTVTDSGGLTAVDTHQVTITPRTLPAVFCQPNLGFGGPGGSTLRVCGGDLSAGTQAEMSLTGAVASTNLVALFGSAVTPTPILGGMIVPIPVIVSLPGITDGSGSWVLPAPLNGGGGPATFYAQVIYIDGAQTFGLGFSNAVQVDILP